MGAYGITSEIIRIRSQKIRFENNDLKHIFDDIPPKSNGQVKNQENNNLQYTGTHCWMHFQAGFIK